MLEILFSLVFLVLLAACVDPFHLWVPTYLHMAALVALIVAAVVYAGLVFRERARDEREAVHRARSSRGGYLAGVCGLSAWVVSQLVAGRTPDKIVVSVLAAMVIVKLILQLWNRMRS